MITLRPYQRDALTAVGAAHRSGAAGVLLVVPTGGGKTIVFTRAAQALAERGACVLIVVPAIELLEQTRDKLHRFGVSHGVIAATYRRNPLPGALVQVGMIQTLRRRPRAMLRTPDYLIIDEAHLAAAASYIMLVERYPTARRLGVTATPWRLDGQGFDALADAIVVGPTVADLIDGGSLCPFRTYSIPLTDYATKGRRQREFDRRAMAAAYAQQQLVGDVVEHYRQRAPGRSAIVFAASLDHSRALTTEFLAAGIAAEHLDGETPDEDRRAILARLESGSTTVVCNYGVLAAGFDCPRVSCVVVARGTASKSLWIQMAGRGMRMSPETGKVDCVILDHGGNARRHGNLAAVHEYRLDGKPRADDDEDLGPVGVDCPRCRLVVDRGTRECPACGFDFTVKAAVDRSVEVVAGELVLLDADAQAAELAQRERVNAARAARYGRAARTERSREWAARMATT